MAAFLLALVMLGLVVFLEECLNRRRKTEATWD